MHITQLISCTAWGPGETQQWGVYRYKCLTWRVPDAHTSRMAITAKASGEFCPLVYGLLTTKTHKQMYNCNVHIIVRSKLMVSFQTENTQILDFTFLPNGFLNRAPVNTYGDL